MSNHHATKSKLEQLDQKLSAGTLKEHPLSISWSEPGASLAHARNRPVSPLHLKNSLGQSMTHTACRYRRSKEITSHLKSLRKKGKEKAERETQRARGKDRCSYEAH